MTVRDRTRLIGRLSLYIVQVSANFQIVNTLKLPSKEGSVSH